MNWSAKLIKCASLKDLFLMFNTPYFLFKQHLQIWQKKCSMSYDWQMIKKIFSYFSQGFIRRWIIATQPWGALQGQTFRRILPFKSWLWRWRLSRCCQVRHLLSHWIYIPLDNRLLRIFKCSIKECNQVLPGAEDNDRRECHIVPTWGLLPLIPQNKSFDLASGPS